MLKEDTILLPKVTGFMTSYAKKKSRLTRAEIVKLLEEAKAGMVSAAECLGADISFDLNENGDIFEPDYEAVQWAQDIVIYADELRTYGQALSTFDARVAKKRGQRKAA